MSEPTDGQERFDEAHENHKIAMRSLRSEIYGIQAAADRLRILQQELRPVLQHTALSLRQLNPTATNAILGLLAVAEALPRDVTQRTARLQDWIKAFPEPPPPPADEPTQRDSESPSPPADDAQEAEPDPASIIRIVDG